MESAKARSGGLFSGFKRTRIGLASLTTFSFEDQNTEQTEISAHAKAGAEQVPHPLSRKAGSRVRHGVWWGSRILIESYSGADDHPSTRKRVPGTSTERARPNRRSSG